MTYSSTNVSHMQSPNLVYLANGKIIGKVENAFLKKNAVARKHMLQKPKGWASDITVLEQSHQLGAIYFQITDIETKINYISCLSDFWKYGIEFNRKYSDQIVLPIKYWEIVFPGQKIMLPIPKNNPKKIEVVQKKFDLPFFGE
jgi:hypothetical protein